MSRSGMQAFNLLLMTAAVALGIAVTVTLIVWIWVPDFTDTAARLLGTEAVVLAAILVNWAINAVLGGHLVRTISRVCYGVTMFCAYAGAVLCILAIWGSTSTEFMWRAVATLAVLFFASMIALAVSATVRVNTIPSDDGPPPPPPPQPQE